MFGIGGFELFLILLFGFLIFGPDKLPAIAKTVGKAIAKFRGAQDEMTEQLKGATFIDKDSYEPLKNPLEVLEGAAAQARTKADAARSVADAATDKAVAASAGAAAAVQQRAESFAERKARYDRERAARKAAEAQAKAEAEAAGGEGAVAAGNAGAAVAAADIGGEEPKADVAVKTVSEGED